MEMTQDFFKSAKTHTQGKTEWELLPAGTYTAKLTDATYDETNGKPVIKFEATILLGDKEGRKVWKRWYITEKTAPYIKGEVSKVLGAQKADALTMDNLPETLCEMYEKTVEIYVKVKPAQGEYKASNEFSINGITEVADLNSPSF